MNISESTELSDPEYMRLHEQVMKDLSTLFGIPERFLLPKEQPQLQIEAKEYEQYKMSRDEWVRLLNDEWDGL